MAGKVPKARIFHVCVARPLADRFPYNLALLDMLSTLLSVQTFMTISGSVQFLRGIKYSMSPLGSQVIINAIALYIDVCDHCLISVDRFHSI